MRIWNITLTTVASVCLFACDSGSDDTAYRSAEADLAEIEGAHEATLSCVQTMDACLQEAVDGTSAQACVTAAQSCLPGEREGEGDTDDVEDSGMPELPEEATGGQGRPEDIDDDDDDDVEDIDDDDDIEEEDDDDSDEDIEEDVEEDTDGGMPELPEQASGRPEMPEVQDAARDAAVCVESATACVEAAADGDAAACGAAVRECVDAGPITDLCEAAEEVCAEAPVEACERVSDRC